VAGLVNAYMPNFMLLATAWGPKFGGINAFNMDFALGLASYLGDGGFLKETFGEGFANGYVKVIDVRGQQGGDLIENFRPEDEAEVRDAITNLGRSEAQEGSGGETSLHLGENGKAVL
jgi:hypothetical protein